MGDGVTDDTTALRAAATAIQAAGGGELIFSRGTYLWNGTTPLSNFTGIKGVTLRFLAGAKIVTNYAYSLDQYVSVFTFTNTSHIRVIGLHGEAPVIATDLNRHAGPVWVDLLDNCDDFDVRGYHQSGIGLRVATTDMTDDTKRAHGGYIDLRGYAQSRVVDFQQSGDNVRGNIMGDSGFRCYLAYGVTNHDIHVRNRNGVDAQVIVQAWDRPTSNITIKYTDVDTTVSRDGAQMVALYFIGPNPQIMRNINVTLDILYGGSTVHQGNGFSINKYAASGGAPDTTDRGHILDGLVLRGRVDGRSFTGDTSQPIVTGGTWGSGEIWRNIDIDLSMNAAGGFNPRTVSPFHVSQIAGRARLDFVAPSGVVFRNGGTDIATLTNRALTLVYGATVTPSGAFGGVPQTITVTDANAFTVAAPLNAAASDADREITIEVFNNTAGAIGAITWNAAFVLVGGAFTNPAAAKKRLISFKWNGSKWIETSRSAADY